MNRQSIINPGEMARKKAQEMALKRKQEYLGARVPKALREKIIAKANQQGIPVSILIRNILEQAMSDDTPADESPVINKYSSVLGWKEIKLNQPMPCADCNRVQKAGSDVMLGISMTAEPPIVLCPNCKASI